MKRYTNIYENMAAGISGFTSVSSDDRVNDNGFLDSNKSRLLTNDKLQNDIKFQCNLIKYKLDRARKVLSKNESIF